MREFTRQMNKSKIMEFWNLRLQRFGIPFAYANAANPADASGQVAPAPKAHKAAR